MQKIWYSVLSISTAIMLSGCMSTVVATTSAGNTLNQQGRSFSTNVSDQVITYKATKAVYDNPEIAKSSRVVIVTFERKVLLVGETPSEALKEKIEQLVHAVPNVRYVYNDMSIRAPLNSYEQGDDGIITANIKTRMFTTTNLRGRDIKVVTENGVVYLMGAVSPSEGRIAAEVARNSAGVKKVVKLFEYTA